MSLRRGLPSIARRVVFATTVAWLAFAAANAHAAAWNPVQPVSGLGAQQFDQASSPALAADGRYVAFVGTLGGVAGIYRRDLATGAVDPVVRTSALAPSISDDGRYVAFWTRTSLDPVNDTNAASDVYVRDMDVPLGQPGALVVASALDGSDEGISYTTASGSVVAGRVALSGDGQQVVFTVGSASNLLDGGTDTSTPADQVVVRNLATRTTRLVSTSVDAATGQQTQGPVPDGADAAAGSAAISADGTTVAWFGENLPEQTRVLSTEQATRSAYSEPLWRSIAEGPAAPTLRVSGPADPFAPGCWPAGESDLASGAITPCDGPFDVGNHDTPKSLLATSGTSPTASNPAPQLSADGSTVAFLADAEPRGSRLAGLGGTANAYVSSMRPGLTRTEALEPLTEWPSSNFSDLLLNDPVTDIAISRDGTHVAFTTDRGVFPLGSPSLVDPQFGRLGARELYDVDLTTQTINRVTRAYDGGQSLGPTGNGGSSIGAASPSYSSDDREIAFGSDASNLFYGDGNTASDVFVAQSATPAGVTPPTLQQVSPMPKLVDLAPAWRLSVSARTLRDGRIQVAGVVPAAGTLAFSATASVRVVKGEHVTVRKRVKVHSHGRVVTRVERVPAVKRVAHLVTRTVATAHAKAGAAGTVSVPLALASRYRSLASAKDGLRATVTATFTASGRRLRQTVVAKFKKQPAPKKKSAKKAAPANRSANRKATA